MPFCTLRTATISFEVPKVLWPAHYTKLEELPSHLAFIKDEVEASQATSHKLTIADVNRDLSGKIVIPQPFGKLKSFYAVESGFCISKFMVIELIIAALIVLIFTRFAPQDRRRQSPRGILANAFEATLLFVRDGITAPAIDSHSDHDHSHHTPHDQDQEAYGVAHIHGKVHHHDGDNFLPILWTMFFFILFCNLFGLLPWLGESDRIVQRDAVARGRDVPHEHGQGKIQIRSGGLLA